MSSNIWPNPTNTNEDVELVQIQRPPSVVGASKDDTGREEIISIAMIGREVNQEDKFPNGGYGWICVFCVFWINVCTWGVSSVCEKIPMLHLNPTFHNGSISEAFDPKNAMGHSIVSISIGR
jgi:hypothetical protein